LADDEEVQAGEDEVRVNLSELTPIRAAGKVRQENIQEEDYGIICGTA